MTDNRTTERIDHPPRVREAIDELMREKDATDNRTTELLCKLLEERGVSCPTHYLHVSWRVGSKLYDAVDNLDGTLTVSSLTPEQAIAATVGSDASAARLAERLRSIADEMRSVGASTMTPHELLAFYAIEVDKVADSLMFAATLGRPKVKKVRGLTYDEHGGEVYYLACSGCGEWIDGDLDCIGEADGPNFCGNCGGEFDGPLLCKRCGKLADMEFGDMCAECYWHESEGNDER